MVQFEETGSYQGRASALPRQPQRISALAVVAVTGNPAAKSRLGSLFLAAASLKRSPDTNRFPQGAPITKNEC
jgi:hypothetical protein